MATITLGNIKFNWKGAYNSSTAYVVDDVVSLSGSSYVCIQAGTNQNPASASAYWEQMSSAGTNGTDLTTTLTTQGDIVYRDGSGLAKLAAGTSGQFLKTQGTGANPEWSDVTTSVLKVETFQTTSRQSLSGGSYQTAMSGNFTKQECIKNHKFKITNIFKEADRIEKLGFFIGLPTKRLKQNTINELCRHLLNISNL